MYVSAVFEMENLIPGYAVLITCSSFSFDKSGQLFTEYRWVPFFIHFPNFLICADRVRSGTVAFSGKNTYHVFSPRRSLFRFFLIWRMKNPKQIANKRTIAIPKRIVLFILFSFPAIYCIFNSFLIHACWSWIRFILIWHNAPSCVPKWQTLLYTFLLFFLYLHFIIFLQIVSLKFCRNNYFMKPTVVFHHSS